MWIEIYVFIPIKKLFNSLLQSVVYIPPWIKISVIKAELSKHSNRNWTSQYFESRPMNVFPFISFQIQDHTKTLIFHPRWNAFWDLIWNTIVLALLELRQKNSLRCWVLLTLIHCKWICMKWQKYFTIQQFSFFA